MSTTNNATEMLGTTATATNSRATLSGLTTGLLADKTNTSFTVGFTTASVGTNTGSITFSFTSSTNGTAAVRTPGGVTNIATQVLSVSGVGYRLAADGLSATNINFGNYRINSTLSSSIGLTNTAANDGYSEKLSISTNSVSASLTISGVTTSLMAAQSNTNVVVGLNSASVGTNNAAFTLSFASDGTGTSGFSATNTGSQVVNVSGVGYRLATAGVSATNVNFGNYRINSTLSSSVALTNTAASDGFSEKLRISTNSISAGLTLGSLPVLIAAQSNTSVAVGMNSASVGTNTGAFTLGFASDGTGTSGFSATNTGSQVVNVGGVGYRLATVGLSQTNINFGNYHIGDILNSSLWLTNTAANDGYSEKLSVSTNSVSGNLTVSGLPSLIAAQSNNSLVVGMNSAGGTNTGAFTLSFASTGTGTSGFSATNIASQVLTVRGSGYLLADTGLAVTNINLGRIHTAGNFASQYLTVSNSASISGYAESLTVAFGAASGGATGNGAVNNNGLLVNLSDNSAGAKTGALQLSATSQAITGSGLGNTTLDGHSVIVTGFVYTGRSTWNLTDSGGWASYPNWDVAGGTPGVDGILSTNDSAVFGTL